MSVEYPTLAEIVTLVTMYREIQGRYPTTREYSRAVVRKWNEARLIIDIEQLNALPDFAVVRDRVGTVWEREDHGSPSTPWWQTGDDRNSSPAQIRLPALLLWHPEVDQ